MVVECENEFRHSFDVEANPSKAFRILQSQDARIAALEAKLAEVRKVKPLEWSDVRQPDEEIRYHHIIAESPIGQWTIQWKGWKDYDDRTVFLDGDFVLNGGDLLEAAKAAAQADFKRRILSALEATPPAPCDHPIWGQDIDGTRTCAKCGLTTPPTHPEPDFSKSIADIIKEESANGAAVGWRSCTGCHETNEGYETGHFPYSKMFGCYVGSGCSECGGIGVTWEYWSEDVLKTMAEDDAPPTPKVTEAMVEAASREYMRIFGKHLLSKHARLILTAAQEDGR